MLGRLKFLKLSRGNLASRDLLLALGLRFRRNRLDLLGGLEELGSFGHAGEPLVLESSRHGGSIRLVKMRKRIRAALHYLVEQVREFAVEVVLDETLVHALHERDEGVLVLHFVSKLLLAELE